MPNPPNPPHPPKIALALQGGGAHGAFTWGVLDRLLQEAETNAIEITAISGTSAGALNATITATALAQHGPKNGPTQARQNLKTFWQNLSTAGTRAGNPLFFPDPSPFGGYNLDNTPAALALEALALLVSPYTNPFYTDALTPLITQALPETALQTLNATTTPRLFITATNVATNARTIFTQPGITTSAVRASCCLPADFKAVDIQGAPHWDGGYLGNPALAPLIDHAQDLLLVLVNALHRDAMPPRTAPAILARLNEITFNASVVLELNAIQAINTLLSSLAAQHITHATKYKPIRLHAIRNDAFAATLGVMSKNSTSWTFLSTLHDAGYDTADDWLKTNRHALGVKSSLDVKAELIDKVMKAPPPRA